ncbi:hypothetical protein OAT67_03310 [Bacteriovoracaceae bacterium]|mgnify:CR=1 FL=1|nr:hypothetical protein [Bacteriovoracaceae bacterium]|tara:strand:+ start:358247 stop:359131 length:885 start_codon:yes stop_codon:yes gene_type:complete
MSLKVPIYYCVECKSIVDQPDDLLFVEETSSRSFCTEECIEKFYDHIVQHFDKEEKKLKKELLLLKEDIEEVIGQPLFMDQALRRPDEVWKIESALDESYYTFISHFNDQKWGEFSLIVSCFVYDNQPSFVISVTATRSMKLVENYRIGEKVDYKEDPSKEGFLKQSVEVDEKVLTEVEHKKSQELARMLEERSPADIPFENFNLFDDYFEATLNEPDELYQHKDDEGDMILTYIKAHEREGVSFYYFILCMKLNQTVQEGHEALIPIISFPTIDGEIYRQYQKGEQLSGKLKN